MCEMCDQREAQSGRAHEFSKALEKLIGEHLTPDLNAVGVSLQILVLSGAIMRLWCMTFDAVEAMEGETREKAHQGLSLIRPGLLAAFEDMRQVLASTNPTIAFEAMASEEPAAFVSRAQAKAKAMAKVAADRQQVHANTNPHLTKLP